MWNLQEHCSEPLREHSPWRDAGRASRHGARQPEARVGAAGGGEGPLTAMHCRMMQLCFIRPGPPNFFMSLQKWHSPHSVRRQASHLRHRVRRRRAPAVVRLAANFTAEAGPSFTLGRPIARFCGGTHGTVKHEHPSRHSIRGCRVHKGCGPQDLGMCPVYQQGLHRGNPTAAEPSGCALTQETGTLMTRRNLDTGAKGSCVKTQGKDGHVTERCVHK